MLELRGLLLRGGLLRLPASPTSWAAASLPTWAAARVGELYCLPDCRELFGVVPGVWVGDKGQGQGMRLGWGSGRAAASSAAAWELLAPRALLGCASQDGTRWFDTLLCSSHAGDPHWTLWREPNLEISQSSHTDIHFAG